LPAPAWLKAHAIRCGSIVEVKGYLAPLIRFWRHDTLLAPGSGGPPDNRVDGTWFLTMTDASNAYNRLNAFVTSLEDVERWCELGTATVRDDFIAVRDLIDMTADVVPGTFVQGLPDQKEMPGVTSDVSILNDVLYRAFFSKDLVTALTDQWTIFPPAAEGIFGGRVPIVGLGNINPAYDFTYLGAPKFGVFDTDITLKSGDADSDIRVPGTEWKGTNKCGGAIMDIRDIFGCASSDEIMVRDGDPGVGIDIIYPINCDDANTIREFFMKDFIPTNHIWARACFGSREGWTVHVWSRFVDEAKVSYAFWAEAQDFGENYVQFIAATLGVPYIRG